MRVDKFLKISRLIKRRSIANQACEKGRVLINSKTAKPGTQITEGDILEIVFGNTTSKVKVITISEHVKKDDAKQMYEIL